ncbi:MAG: hypothetical protein AAGC47_15610 [Bacteroidota bacterium]
MAKWALNFSNPTVGDKKIIERLNEVPQLNSGAISEYALGQFPIIYKGLQAYEHSGAEAAFESYFLRIPKYDFAVAVLANSGSFWAEGRGRDIADIYLEGKLEPPLEEKTPSYPKVELQKVNGDSLKKYLGNYWCKNEHLQREVIFQDSSLWYSRSSSSENELLPISDSVFVMKDLPTIVQISFRKVGKDYQMSFTNGRDTLLFEKIKTVDLNHYQGVYYSRELDTYYKFQSKTDILVAEHQRLSDISFYPIKENSFYSRAWFFKSIQFSRNDDDEVTGFHISNRGVTDLWFQKISDQ